MKGNESKTGSKAGSDSIAPMPIIPVTLATPSTPLVAVPIIQDEEYATELTQPMDQRSHFQTSTSAKPISRTWGWSAMVVSIISLFILPVVIGSVGIILGVLAIINGNRALGGWSIAISVVSIFTSLILVPYYS